MVSLVVELFVVTVVCGFDAVVLWRYLLVGLFASVIVVLRAFVWYVCV